MKTICKPKVIHDEDAEFPWNVQLWYSYDGGMTYSYCGQGKFFKEHGEELQDYIREHTSK